MSWGSKRIDKIEIAIRLLIFWTNAINFWINYHTKKETKRRSFRSRVLSDFFRSLCLLVKLFRIAWGIEVNWSIVSFLAFRGIVYWRAICILYSLTTTTTTTKHSWIKYFSQYNYYRIQTICFVVVVVCYNNKLSIHPEGERVRFQ